MCLHNNAIAIAEHVHENPGQVEGFEIFIKFLPPSASAASLKEFFGEVRGTLETASP